MRLLLSQDGFPKKQGCKNQEKPFHQNGRFRLGFFRRQLKLANKENFWDSPVSQNCYSFLALLKFHQN
jgi:hypothetical protein